MLDFVFSTEPIGNGHEFVFGVPTAKFSDHPHVMISTASDDPIYATVTIPGTDFVINKTVTEGLYVDIRLPDSIYLEGSGKQENKTVVVRATREVSVHVMVNEGRAGDGFLVLPTSRLGTDHYVLSYQPLSRLSRTWSSFILVSASNSDVTTVKITNKSDHKRSISLEKYESYQLISLPGEDLSGSRVIGDHPITVIAGTENSLVGTDGFGSTLVELIPPVCMWGTFVVMSPFAGKDNGYKYRVLGTNVTTNVTIGLSDVETVTLTEGQCYKGDVIDDTIVTIESNYPILVMQYIKGGGKPIAADPSMIFAPSTSMYNRNSTTFPVYSVPGGSCKYFIHVIIECAFVQGLLYDNNASVGNWKRLKSDNEEICSVGENVTAGVHTISHEDSEAKFTVAVYGLGVEDNYETSFSYPASIHGTRNNSGKTSFIWHFFQNTLRYFLAPKRSNSHTTLYLQACKCIKAIFTLVSAQRDLL